MKFRQAKKIVKAHILKRGEKLSWKSQRLHETSRACHRNRHKLRACKELAQ